MGKRHETIGIKQTIRLEWMHKTTNLLQAGLDSKTIRKELHDYLADKKGDGSIGKRSERTRTFAVNNLMKVWVTPDSDLIPFRNASLEYLSEQPDMALPVHWGMISAAYPFWFNVARQTGRLLALQDQVTSKQVINRLKEQYGDRQTVSRFSLYVVRSFVAWGILHDSGVMGCYQKAKPMAIVDSQLAFLLLEAVLQAMPEGRGAFRGLMKTPAAFPFTFPVLSGMNGYANSERMEVINHDCDSEYLRLK